MKTPRDRTIALAAIVQAATLVDALGRSGSCDEKAKNSCLYSLLQTNPPSVEAVFGGLDGVGLGLRSLRHELMAKTTHNLQITQYLIQLMHLEAKLRKAPEHLDGIAKGLAEAERHSGLFPPEHPNAVARFADLYVNFISSLGPRIMVKGEGSHLNNSHIASLIRALLLAGIRGAILWRQCGGNRLRIVFGRGSILKETNQLLAELEASQAAAE
jgi:high frequency lysogenization protein